ncbi:MAG: sulfatase/phosphatase domain-containing protein [Planctomycetota bacterium]|jgi:arylsulfatase A-like enzyme
MLNRGKPVHSTLFFAYKDIQRGLRDDRYKLIEYSVKDARTTQLFDLKTDPAELNNLADDPAYTPHLRRLRTELLAWKDHLRDNSPFWQSFPTP